MYLIGKKFKNLLVLEKIVKGKHYYYECLCDCGNKVLIRADNLKNRKSSKCIKCRNHQKANTRIYHIWENMKSRCYNENNPRFKNYGAKNIKVCIDWKEKFISFYNWAIQNGYEENLSIDRINNNGDYEPNNCRWVDTIIQANNTSRNHYERYKDKNLTLAQWARELKIKKKYINSMDK